MELRRATALVLGLGAMGCPEPLFEDEMCGAEGDLSIELANRDDPSVIGDGSEVAVFPPPQGGVFTELDVAIAGTEPIDIHEIELELRDAGGALLAFEPYQSVAGLPVACQDDGTLRIDNLPVGFEFETVLQDLEGVTAALACRLDAEVGTTTVEYEVVLRVTGY